jgi:hypothetical protein
VKLKQKSNEYQKFAALLGRVSKAPHDAVKAKLEEEKKAKKSGLPSRRKATS